MKKFNYLFLIIILSLSIFTITYATDNDKGYLYMNESGELVQASGDFRYDDAEIIDDNSKLDNLYQNDEYNKEQEELKEIFNEQKDYYAQRVDSEFNTYGEKLTVIEILSDIKTTYMPTDYTCYLINYQLARVINKENEINSAIILLSQDIASDNKVIKPLKNGDTVYGYTEYITSDTEQYNIIPHEFTDEKIAVVSVVEQDRALGIILLTIFALLLLLLYTGKSGAKLLIPIFIAIDLLFIVFAPEIEIGKNILIMASLIALELIILITVLKNGISRKTLVAIISSIIVVFLITCLAGYFAYTNRLSGQNLMYFNPQSNMYYMEAMFKSEIDTPMLYLAGIILITSVITSTIASKLTELSEKYAGSKTMADNIIEEAKLIISEYPMIITIIFLVTILPKYLTILLNGSSLVEILNSETLITEFSALLITLISVAIISPIHALISSLLMGDVEIKQIENKKD